MTRECGFVLLRGNLGSLGDWVNNLFPFFHAIGSIRFLQIISAKTFRRSAIIFQNLGNISLLQTTALIGGL